ncbi:copper amine oxidase N-terminal domain-containing protein [Calidifontibacillus oryziterrae]|uniref:copper amine oxidase N-terminal domain-containing protein n=1 Tax=Calidifontibacillus oryziterrae TaxID=1191699 RepID=UPI00030AABB5|nr:copper amine oxidase N-terminal domain-containing protein [Calidifontibacillus oryziterrae]
MQLFYKYITAFVFLLSFSLIISTQASAQNEITVYLDGNRLSFDVSPTIQNGTTLVPMRKIFESLGASISYDGKSQTVFASKSGTEIKLQIGSKYPLINGKKTEIQVPGKIVNGRTLVPLRFVSESLGAVVNWNGTTRTITISAGNSASDSASNKTDFRVIRIY